MAYQTYSRLYAVVFQILNSQSTKIVKRKELRGTTNTSSFYSMNLWKLSKKSLTDWRKIKKKTKLKRLKQETLRL